MTYLITGATGFLGSKLIRQLVTQGDSVHYLARKRNPKFDSQVSFHYWDLSEEAPLKSVPRMDAIIHLLGEPVAQRWSDEVKQRIHSSRIEGTRKLVTAIGQLRHRPEVLVSASAVGYYGSRGDEVLTESSGPGSDFLAKVCVDWEAEAEKARAFGVRVVPVRVGTVLGREGGAFPMMARPAQFGLGATFGNGKQWMSWIHAQDLIDLLLFVAANRSVTTTVNGASTEPVTNAAFTKALGQALHRPAFLSVPSFVLRAAMGEMSDLLFASLRVVPRPTGFEYRYGKLADALPDLVQ